MRTQECKSDLTADLILWCPDMVDEFLKIAEHIAYTTLHDYCGACDIVRNYVTDLGPAVALERLKFRFDINDEARKIADSGESPSA
jgi:hypothetical protein